MKEAERQHYSVLMSVYSKEKPEYLRLAMNSMWEQTVPTNDFVLVADGPLNTALDSVIEEMQQKHKELHVIRLEQNQGLGNALNIGLKVCRNEIICRMDSDDISNPDRCEKQLNVFSTMPDLSICSGTITEFTENINDISGKREVPELNEEIVIWSKKRNPFNHMATMFKKTDVEAVGSYSEQFHLFEDYHLWIRMLQAGYRGYNLQTSLVNARMPDEGYDRRGGAEYAKCMLKFHSWLLETDWTKKGDYLTGALPHALVCVLPLNIRRMIYKRLHR